MKRVKQNLIYDTKEECLAFIEGVEYVNDSDIECEPDPIRVARGWKVVFWEWKE
jgi:hypothetical protein